MAQSRPEYFHQFPDNDVDLRSSSIVHMTLSLSGLPYRHTTELDDSISYSEPRFRSVLPIRNSHPAIQGGFRCGTFDGEYLNRSPVLIKQEPLADENESHLVECPEVSNPPVVKMEDTFETGRSAHQVPSVVAPRSNRRPREPGYDAATLAHFKQHLGVIDCRESAFQPWSKPEPYQLPGPLAPPQPSNHALQDYQMQLMLLEQQKRKRDLMIKQEDALRRAHANLDQSGTNPQPYERLVLPPLQISEKKPRLQDYQQQLMQLEQQNKKRLMARRAQSPPTDYQMQLMQLEQQNKKRLMLARMEQAPSTS